MKTLLITALIGFSVVFAPVAVAGTGDNPQLDHLCTNQAFKNASHGIGLAGKNGYCKSGAVHPADYGDKNEPSNRH